MNRTPRGRDRGRPARPADPSGPSRSCSAGLLVLSVPAALLLLVGCGRLRHDVRVSSTTSSTAAASSAAGAGSTTPTSSGSEAATLASIDQQLSTVGSQLSSVNGDLGRADSAINSQEGDPSK